VGDAVEVESGIADGVETAGDAAHAGAGDVIDCYGSRENGQNGI
jgi:hypothetical protein